MFFIFNNHVTDGYVMDLIHSIHHQYKLPIMLSFKSPSQQQGLKQMTCYNPLYWCIFL